MNTRKIAIIGGGNLGIAMAEGLLKSGFTKAGDLTVTRRTLAHLQSLKAQGVTITDNNQKAIESSEVIIVALKPYNVREVLEGLKNSFDPSRHIVISVVTGVSLMDLSAIIGSKIPLFRAMPNTAIAI
ncbi:MAG: NAD(P)-binding domain-containing protein, partial [Cyclobacteriaceae bacterium]|nr:NAD(P)-binding domain-containing protein [Cyclobacteriaceae bacterium]